MKKASDMYNYEILYGFVNIGKSIVRIETWILRVNLNILS